MKTFSVNSSQLICFAYLIDLGIKMNIILRLKFVTQSCHSLETQQNYLIHASKVIFVVPGNQS